MSKTKAQAIEWIGALTKMPGYVKGKHGRYQPEVLIWMLTTGHVVGFITERPGALLSRAVDHFRLTAKAPMVGAAHMPSRVRVASQELADTLRAALPASVEIACEPTPEIEMLMHSMEEAGGLQDQEEVDSYLTTAEPDAVAAFFNATAALFRIAPWRIVPSHRSLFSVSVPRLGVNKSALSLIGKDATPMIGLFARVADFESFLVNARAMLQGKPAAMPPHLSLTFGTKEQLSATAQDEIQHHGWEIAAPDAHPWMAAIGGSARPVAANEITLFEALSRAMMEIAKEPEIASGAAFTPGETWTRTLNVPTAAGDVEVTLLAPHPDALASAQAHSAARAASNAAAKAKKDQRKKSRDARKRNR
jgi:hypothetical protein